MAPLKVCFSNPEPLAQNSLFEVFSENLLFDQSCNSFDIENEVLSHAYNQENQELMRVIKPIADELMDKIVIEEYFEAKVRVFVNC